MKYADILSPLNLSFQAANSVSLLLERISNGSDEVYQSPIVNEDRSPSDILDGLDRLFNTKTNLSKMNKTLIDFELGNRSKYGPRSIALPWIERRLSFFETFGNGVTGVESILSAIRLGDRRLRPLSAAKAVEYLKNNTSAGIPSMRKKRDIKPELVGMDWKQEYDKRYPSVLFTRTQENKKTRDVWGINIFTILFEMMYYRPLLDLQLKQSWRAALRQPSDVDLGITKLMDAAFINEFPCLSMDFKSYDKTVKQGLQKVGFSSIKTAYQPSYYDDLDLIAENFKTVSIITPEGIMKGNHGVPSGSAFTNELDSIVQKSSIDSISEIKLKELCQIQGDDGAYACIKGSESKIFEVLRTYGLEPSEDPTKSVISYDHMVYLQSLYHRDYRGKDGVIHGIYSIYRAILRIVYLERFDDFSKDEISGRDYFSIRTITILENCKHHPLFEEFVKYVYSLDKYKLEFSNLGLANYVKSLREKEGKDINFRTWSYGGNIEGIRSFESYKIIKELGV